MGLLDIFKGSSSANSSGSSSSNSGFKLNLEKPLSVDLVKGFKQLNLHKSDVRDNSLFLIDVSGSMDETVKQIRKIDSVREVMSMIPNANMVCFSSRVHNTHNNQIPEPNGGTEMGNAFRHIRSLLKTNTQKIVLVSDGEPNSRSEALTEARKLGVPVDVIYIGAEGDAGETFMKELANTTGGIQLTP